MSELPELPVFISNAQLTCLVLNMLKSKSQSQVAREIGVSPVYIADIANNRKNPGEKIAMYFGYEKIIIYRKIT